MLGGDEASKPKSKSTSTAKAGLKELLPPPVKFPAPPEPGLLLHVSVRNVREAVSFYKAAFGAVQYSFLSPCCRPFDADAELKLEQTRILIRKEDGYAFFFSWSLIS